MPFAQSWLELEKAMGGRPVLRGGPTEMRAQFEGLSQMLLPLYPPPSENVAVQEGDVDGIKYRVYTPKASKGGLPLAIWTHGGGFMLGDLNTDDLLCRVVSEHTNSAVVNIDYRLTPEQKAPTQLDDSWKVYKWAHQNASSFGADNSKVYTIGGSAGGCLALALANKAVHDSELKAGLKGIVAIVPISVHPDNVPSKYASQYKAWTENANDVPIIDKESMDIFYEQAGSDPKDSSMFTLLAEENHALFPPTYFVSCEFDPLRDDAFIMEAALKEKGVKTKHDHWKGLPHYFWIFPQVQESGEFMGKLFAGIEWVKSQM